MKFDRLQASILNNADQSPSLYMALCMVESLFADLENACGTEISHCPVGSDMLPSKLIWLCNHIRDIYADNSDSLQRNRARLNMVMGKLNQVFEELEELQGISETLEARQAEYDDLQQQLEERQADACAYETLSQSCQRATQQLELLRQFDPDAANAELAKLNIQISALESEKAALSTQLEQAVRQSDSLRQDVDGLKAKNEDTLRQIDTLNGQLQQGGDTAAALQAQLEDLQAGRTDLDAVRRQLSDRAAALQAEIADLESAKADLSRQLEQAQPRAEALGQEVEQLRSEDQQLHRQLSDLTGQLSRIQEEDAGLRKELADRKADLATLESARENLVQAKQTADEEYILLHQRISTFREEELNPAQVLLEVIRQELAQLEQSKQEADQACAQAKQERDQLTLAIARQKAEIDTLNGKLNLSQNTLKALQQEKSGLDEKHKTAIQTLERLQEEVSQLEKQQLPELQRLQEQEQLRKQTLQKLIEQAQEQLAYFREEKSQLEQKLPKLEEDLKNDRTVYDALTASYTSSSKELEDLERQIAELRTNSNEQTLEIYRKQLEQTQRQLEEIQRECDQIQQENTRLQEQLTQGQNKRAELQERKRRHESGLEATEKQLRELSFATSEKYIREVSVLWERVKLLENVRVKLAASMSNMHRILGNTPVEEGTTLEDQFLKDLRQLRQHIEDLRTALLSCAKSLKLEER